MAKFKLGRLFSTLGAIEAAAAAGDDLLLFVARHVADDRGTVDAADARANDRALRDGSRLLSAYLLKDGTKIWIITEADRSATTALLPNGC